MDDRTQKSGGRSRVDAFSVYMVWRRELPRRMTDQEILWYEDSLLEYAARKKADHSVGILREDCFRETRRKPGESSGCNHSGRMTVLQLQA